jgi:hypothetical protein
MIDDSETTGMRDIRGRIPDGEGPPPASSAAPRNARTPNGEKRPADVIGAAIVVGRSRGLATSYTNGPKY